MKLRKLTNQRETTGEQQGISHDEILLSNANTPIYILPDDILTEIWSYVCGDRVHPRPRHISIPFVLMISWVSSRWRNVSINAPLLWCGTIHVNATQSIGTIRAQVERSKRCPLIIKADSRVPSFSGAEIDMTCMLKKVSCIANLVLGEFDRWRVFEFVDFNQSALYSDRFEDVVLGPLETKSPPRLERLSIEIELESHSKRILFNGGTPVLSAVRLKGMNVRSNQHLLTGLTSLNLKHIPFFGRVTHAELHRIFIACPLLADLTLEDGVYSSELASSSETLHAPSLLSLSYDNTYANQYQTIGQFLSHLSAPRLKSLTLSSIGGFSFDTFMAAVKPTASGSPPKFPVLSDLHLLSCAIEDCRELTRCFPLIDCLGYGGSAGFRLLEYLVFSDRASGLQEGTVWPHLRTLHMHEHIPVALICRLIEGRIAMGCPVTTLRIPEERFLEVHPAEREWFHDHVEVQSSRLPV